MSTAEKPPLIEGPGRYVVYALPDGGWTILRAGPICDRCENCGCGEQGEPVNVPGIVVQMAMSQGKQRLMGALKAMRNGR